MYGRECKDKNSDAMNRIGGIQYICTAQWEMIDDTHIRYSCIHLSFCFFLLLFCLVVLIVDVTCVSVAHSPIYPLQYPIESKIKLLRWRCCRQNDFFFYSLLRPIVLFTRSWCVCQSNVNMWYRVGLQYTVSWSKLIWAIWYWLLIWTYIYCNTCYLRSQIRSLAKITAGHSIRMGNREEEKRKKTTNMEKKQPAKLLTSHCKRRSVGLQIRNGYYLY